MDKIVILFEKIREEKQQLKNGKIEENLDTTLQ